MSGIRRALRKRMGVFGEVLPATVFPLSSGGASQNCAVEEACGFFEEKAKKVSGDFIAATGLFKEGSGEAELLVRLVVEQLKKQEVELGEKNQYSRASSVLERHNYNTLRS